MDIVSNQLKNTNAKIKPLSKEELVKKMLKDQKIIREALQKGISLKELEKTHGFKFARL